MSSSLGFARSRSFTGQPTPTNDHAVTSRQPHPLPRPAPVVDLLALQNASRVLQDQLLKDSQIIPDLGETLTACMSCLLYLLFFDVS
jgi:hypothetical protein